VNAAYYFGVCSLDFGLSVHQKSLNPEKFEVAHTVRARYAVPLQFFKCDRGTFD